MNRSGAQNAAAEEQNRLDALNRANDFAVLSIEDDRFSSYGRIIHGSDVSGLIRVAGEDTLIPEDGNIYVAAFSGFGADEKCRAEIQAVQSVIYGGARIQAGYCNGRNSTFNGFEYHKASEINIAVTDFCLALGHSWDISAGLEYDIDKAEVFYVPEGTVFEMFGTTLHLSPIRVTDDGFKDIVILPEGTNTPLSDEEKLAAKEAFAGGDCEAGLLLQKAKWVISHPEREPLIKQGAHPGVTGPNKELKY